MKLLLSTILALVPPSTVTASGCHGVSRFRLAPAHPRKSKSKLQGADQAAKKAVLFSKPEKDRLCELEYAEGAKLMDLEQMEGEFQNPADLRHALNPLFAENPQAVYYVADHGVDEGGDHHKFVLKMEDNSTISAGAVQGTLVSGSVFKELEADNSQQEAEILCFIPKPKYDAGGMSMSMPMTSQYHQVQDKEEASGSSFAVPLFAVVAVAALGIAAFQTYKANTMANQAATTLGGSLDLGGAYSVLSASENDLAEQLAPSSTELV